MDMLRKHLFFIICGLVATAGIALGVWVVWWKMSNVKKDMVTAIAVHRRISSHINDPPSEEKIRAAQAANQAYVKQYEIVIQSANQAAANAQLMPNFFPQPNLKAKHGFRGEYRKSLEALYDRLRAGTIPTPDEVADQERRLKEEASGNAGKNFGMDATEAAKSGAGTAPPVTEAGSTSASGLVSAEHAKKDPYILACLSKAHMIYCYAIPPAALDASSLDVAVAVYQDTGVAPDVKDCWYAQLSLWVQQDVVDAIMRVNKAAADRIEQSGEAPWVGTLPVKDLISLRVSKYHRAGETAPGADAAMPMPMSGMGAPVSMEEARPTGGSSMMLRGGPPMSGPPMGGPPMGGPSMGGPPGMSGGGPPGMPSPTVSAAETAMLTAPSFTANASGEDYEVVRFAINAVVDARDLPTIVAEICNNKYTTLYRIQYQAVPPNLTMQGKIYGGVPAVNVTMEFETLFFSKTYLPLMPDDVLTELGKQRPATPEATR